MRLPWSKKPLPQGQQVILAAVSSTGLIPTRGHQEVLSWLAGQTSDDALANVINQTARDPRRVVRKIAPPARGTDAVNGWLASQSDMCVSEIIEARNRASTDITTSRRDSLDLMYFNSSRASVSSRTSVGSEVRDYLDGIGEAAEAGPEEWDVEVYDAIPPSPAEPVDGKYLALALEDGCDDEEAVPETWGDFQTAEDEEGEEEDYEDDIRWAPDAVRGNVLPLASAAPRKAIIVDRPSFTPMETEHANLPVCVGQPMRPQVVDIPGTVSFSSDSSDQTDGPQAQGYQTLPTHPALRGQDFTVPDCWDDGWMDEPEPPVAVKVTPPSHPAPEPPVPESQDKDKFLAVPDIDTLSEPPLDTESLVDYYLDSNNDPESDSDSGRDSIGNFKCEVEEEEPCHLLGLAAQPYLDTIRQHLSLPSSTSPREVQHYLSRNVEIIRATMLGVVCNPRFLAAQHEEISASPTAKQHNKAFAQALGKIDWDTDMAQGGLVPACTGALAAGEAFVTQRMRKRSREHLAPGSG
ncbi:hypothetical protein B0T11DRAFT_355360 [Plectosphaerella cucumerina]|uniref:Uncharacterized protein n=1 Tax=Plectosphaerella cucumerina TaxID=40658 RepID=A0A8K0TD77_9PEZI|nr:hypothetical protein B0T11DRAFT_355360 [Plectosphaerella cucumerina]